MSSNFFLNSTGPALSPGVHSRAITAENPTGAKGSGGREASSLGKGRKGKPCLTLRAGEVTTLADIDGAGRVTHLWFAFPERTGAVGFVLRDLVLRAFWDGEPDPSVEVPIGDFFCCGAGARCLVTSLPVVVAPTGGMNCYWPMPFETGARITITNEHPADVEGFFFQVDFELWEDTPVAPGRFHAQWRRENPTVRAVDYTLLDGVRGRGAYVGTFLSVVALERFWWGEGEMKFYLDGDEEFPTICGTGTEDYAGGAWAFQDRLSSDTEPHVITFNAPFSGYAQYVTRDDSHLSVYATPMAPVHGLYRWHLPDPIHFAENLRVTTQQIAQVGVSLCDRSDDVSSVGYWYQLEPHAPFPAFPSRPAPSRDDPPGASWPEDVLLRERRSRQGR